MKPRALLVGVTLVALAGIALGAQAVPSSSAAYIARVTNPTNTVSTAANFTCAGATNVAAERAGAIFVYPLNENGLSYLLGATDQSGHAVGAYRGGFATSTTTPLACPRDQGGAYVLNGTSSYVSNPTQLVNPTTFSVEVWFKSTVASGKLIGFGNGTPLLPSTSTQFDRHVYFATSGQLVFGVNNGTIKTITSPLAYNDGLWHHLVASLSSAGMVLYVDGAPVAADPAVTTAANTTGYWRVGYDSLAGWPGTGANYYFTGQMRWAAVYSIALTQAQVTNHYLAGR